MSDYDLTNIESLPALRSTLDHLKSSALEQENAVFDASGTGGHHPADNGGSHYSASLADDGSGLKESEVATLTTALSDLSWHGVPGISYHDGETQGELNMEQKRVLLREMFPTVDDYTVKHTLGKTDGALNRAMDILLNLSFLVEDEGAQGGDSLVPKGVDGFAAMSENNRGRRRKGKRKTYSTGSTRSSSATSSMDDLSITPSNRWLAAAQDVDFICSRSNIPKETAKSKYHTLGASLPATIHAFALAEASTLPSSSQMSSAEESQVAELANHFPSVTTSELRGLLTIARRSTSAAHELAEAMMRRTDQQNKAGSLQIITRHAPIDVSPAPQSAPLTPSLRWATVDHESTRELALSNALQGHDAFTNASAAYRKGKSDHLMGGAAAYYSEVGRAHIEAAKSLQAAAANSFVHSQSTATMLDLHGVSVADATRIARVKVEEWWESLGDAKYACGRGGPARQGYRVVTGLGRHSKDGASRLGPAVTKTLVREGWKVEIGHGELIVTGKVRH